MIYHGDRFPSNLILSHNPDCFTEETYIEDVVYEPKCTPDCAVAMLDEQSGDLAKELEYFEIAEKRIAHGIENSTPAQANLI